MHKGRVVFGAMDEVVFGRPAAEAIGERREGPRPDGALDRQTDESGKIPITKALAPRGVAMFDVVPRTRRARSFCWPHKGL